MRKYRGREEAPQGIYLSLSTWEFIQLQGDACLLPGEAEARYFRAPVVLAMTMGPLAGLALVIFLPTIGIVWFAFLLANRMWVWVRDHGRMTLQPAGHHAVPDDEDSPREHKNS